MSFPRSTKLLVGSFVIGLPFLYFEHPREILGPVGFNALAVAMFACAIGGFSYWITDRK